MNKQKQGLLSISEGIGIFQVKKRNDSGWAPKLVNSMSVGVLLTCICSATEARDGLDPLELELCCDLSCGS